MASTYSTNLALELIATGEQSGSWGATTNTNLGTLLEQAISGYVTQAITDGAATVITIPNGATGVARNMAIEMTGALTAARVLEVPANKKLYFIYNNTSGGFAVTVKVSGQTGVSVPNGKKAILVSNGTDIVEAVNQVVGNLAVGGTLGVTGTSTLAAVNSSAVAATTDLNALTPLRAIDSANTNGGAFVGFTSNSALCGTITRVGTTSAVAYNTTSAAELKNKIGPAPVEVSRDIVMASPISEWTWKDDPTGKHHIGPIAQELYASGFRGAVTPGRMVDVRDEAGNKTGEEWMHWGVDKTAFTWHLVVVAQDHERRISALEKQVSELLAELGKNRKLHS